MTNLAELFTLLEFEKIVAHLKQISISEMTHKKFDSMDFMRDKAQIQTALNEVSEFQEILELDDPFPMQQIWDTTNDLNMASVEGNYLNCKALVCIAQNLKTSSRVQRFLHSRQEKYPHLCKHSDGIFILNHLVKEIEAKIDFVSFEMKDNASPKLNHIRKSMAQAEQKVRRVVDKLFKSYSQKGFLQ